MQQLTLPSSNLANYSNVSKQSETLISGLNNITFNNNTCIFNNNLISYDKSVSLDLINKIFYNLESISFNDSIIKGINDGYIIDENDDLVLDYNPNNALSTVFGYNIKNQSDKIENNLNVEIMSRQNADNIIIDLIDICNQNALHAESMIHYIDYDLINHSMLFFIPVPKTTNVDKLPANNILKLTEEEIKTSNPNLTISEIPIEEYENIGICQFDKDGVHMNDLYSNYIKTSLISFDDGNFNGLDYDIMKIDIGNNVFEDNYQGNTFSHTVCSFLIRYHFQRIYEKIARLGILIDFIMQEDYNSPQTNDKTSRSVKFVNPFGEGDLGVLTEELNLKSDQYKTLTNIKNLQDTVANLTLDKKIYIFLNEWDITPIKDNREFQWIKCNKPLEINYYKDKYRDIFPTLKILGNIEVEGNIYIVDRNKKKKNYSLKTKNHFDAGDDDASEMSFNPRYHEHSISHISGLIDSLNNKANISTIDSLNNRINDLETTIKDLTNKNNKLLETINEIKDFIKMCSWNTYEHQIDINTETT